jgi:phosphoribosylformylglycinamidine synthase
MDCVHALAGLPGCEPRLIWHKSADLEGADALILPGGFAHGDYLRAGAIARFSPVMREVERFARAGGPVLGICNGFQVLTEAGMLPGALLRNREILFYCSWVHVRVESNRSPWLSGLAPGAVLRLAVAHGQGNYYADDATLEALGREGGIALRYCNASGEVTPASNHNGSTLAIAGVKNAEGNVLGLMPHPERSADLLLGSADGRTMFESVLRSTVNAAAL